MATPGHTGESKEKRTLREICQTDEISTGWGTGGGVVSWRWGIMRCVLDVRQHWDLHSSRKPAAGHKQDSILCNSVYDHPSAELYNNPPSMTPISRLSHCQLAASKLWRLLWKSHLWHWHCALYWRAAFEARRVRLQVSPALFPSLLCAGSGVYLLFPTDSWVRYL